MLNRTTLNRTTLNRTTLNRIRRCAMEVTRDYRTR